MKYGAATSMMNKYLDLLNGNQDNVSKVCNAMAEYTEALLEGNYPDQVAAALKNVAETYRNTTSSMTKIAIENVFLYRVGKHIAHSGRTADFIKLLPQVFRELTMHQMRTAD